MTGDTIDLQAIEGIVRGMVQSIVDASLATRSDTIRTGVSAQNEQTDEEASVAAQKAASGQVGPSCNKDEETVPAGLTSFQVYWDVSASKLKMFDPVVVLPDGTSQTPEAPTLAEGNTYYLHVLLDDEGTYTSYIDASEDGGKQASAVTTKWHVKIAKLGDTVEPGYVTQYHTGAFVICGGGGDSTPGCFEIDDSGNIINPYVMVGDILMDCGVSANVYDYASAGTTVILAVSCSAMSDKVTSGTIETFSSLGDLLTAQQNAEKHVLPLYEITYPDAESFEIVCDFRKGVHAQQWEVFS